MTQAPDTWRELLCEAAQTIDELPGYPKGADLCDRIEKFLAAAPLPASPAADRAVSEPGEYMLTDDAFDALQEQFDCFADEGREGRLREFADACYSAGWNDGETPAAPPADRAELAEKAKETILRLTGDSTCKLRGCLVVAKPALDAIDALARSTDAPSTHLLVHKAIVADIEVVGRQCLDSGTCHHGCVKVCSRREGCVPLSLAASYLNDDWTLKTTHATPPAAATSTPCACGERATIAQAIRMLEACRDEYMTEYASTDPETGAAEYGRGPRAEAREEYVGELSEVIDRLVALENAS